MHITRMLFALVAIFFCLGAAAFPYATPFSGTWKIQDEGGKMAGTMTLQQFDEGRISGTAVMRGGTAAVEGAGGDRELRLTFRFDSIDPVVCNVPQKDLVKLRGITSRMILQADRDTHYLEGMLHPWYCVVSGEKIAAIHEGGSAEATRGNPPRRISLTRTTELCLVPDNTWTVNWAPKRYLEITARIESAAAAGASYLLGISINNNSLSETLLNKRMKMRYADKREFSYFDRSKSAWLLFYSPDFTLCNTPAAGGYEVLSDPGQAYLYRWNVSRFIIPGYGQMNIGLTHIGAARGKIFFRMRLADSL